MQLPFQFKDELPALNIVQYCWLFYTTRTFLLTLFVEGSNGSQKWKMWSNTPRPLWCQMRSHPSGQHPLGMVRAQVKKKSYQKAWLILHENAERILTSQGYFHSEWFAGVEHSSTVANYCKLMAFSGSMNATLVKQPSLFKDGSVDHSCKVRPVVLG